MSNPHYHLPDLIPGHQVYPIAYGNEEETGLMDNHSGKMGDPNQLANNLAYFLPEELESFENFDSHLFLQNGGKLYQDGSQSQFGPGNIERATPECIDPDQLNLYIRAGEMLLLNTVGGYIAEISEIQPGAQIARIQRRVIDGRGNRKGCHDNFGVSELSPMAEFRMLPPAVLGHLASRSFITGAGLVTKDGTNFAQKVGGLVKVAGYGYAGSMYRMSGISGTPRLEIRCNDINISEWAVRARIGSTAVAIALNQTELGSQLEGMYDPDVLMAAQQMNVMKLNADGSLIKTPELVKAVDLQMAQADLALSRLFLYTDELTPQLDAITREVYAYCDDFKKVLAKESDITLLADRADWAAKFSIILRRMNQDVKHGLPRTMTDSFSQACDMKYDYIGLTAEDGYLKPIKYGFAYKLREKGYFRGQTLTDKAIARAYFEPPAETRAKLRGNLISEYFIAQCNWHMVALHEGLSHQTFRMEDVLQNEFDLTDQIRLENIKQRRFKT